MTYLLSGLAGLVLGGAVMWWAMDARAEVRTCAQLDTQLIESKEQQITHLQHMVTTLAMQVVENQIKGSLAPSRTQQIAEIQALAARLSEVENQAKVSASKTGFYIDPPVIKETLLKVWARRNGLP